MVFRRSGAPGRSASGYHGSRELYGQHFGVACNIPLLHPANKEMREKCHLLVDMEEAPSKGMVKQWEVGTDS
ncbi:hypothetical protein COCON_G00032100 [Conger conger]|uniref:Uncharacterized protein n=1 Tax=Conger conger TaxID=82655 RepID=A0A9Q1DYV9_CONCO|nr:hypothetical protein COCON_G00032100 [Conger conger]